MPVVDIKLNLAVSQEVLTAVSAEVTHALSAALDRACPSVMIAHSQGPLWVNESPAPAAWVQVLLVTELHREAKRNLCKRLAEILAQHCSVDPARVFLRLSRVPPEDAWNITSHGPCCVLDGPAHGDCSGRARA